MGLRHILQPGGEVSDIVSRAGLPCSVALLGGHVQVDMQVFTLKGLHTRRADANAPAVTPYFIL